ncbi:MAG: hypothetical protein ACXWC7_11415 [Chitinophagaceae bacterium]
MKQEISVDNKTQSNKINRLAYMLYMLLVLFQLITGEYDWAVANMGIALVFDPFAPVKWEDRTKLQKTCLFIHLSLLITGATFLIFR